MPILFKTEIEDISKFKNDYEECKISLNEIIEVNCKFMINLLISFDEKIIYHYCVLNDNDIPYINYTKNNLIL